MSDPPRFPAATRSSWAARAQRELGTRPLTSLTRISADGVAVRPVYFREDVEGLPLDSPSRRDGWRAIQEYRQSPRAANLAARADLERGADGAWFGPGSAARAGVVAEWIDGIDPSRTPVFIDAGVHAPKLIDELEVLWAQRDWPEPTAGGVIHDPLALAVRSGRLAQNLGEGVDAVLGTERGSLGISLVPYHEGGASPAEELALGLASTVELARAGEPIGLEFADLAERMVWTFAIATEPFAAIAKLRAASRVWVKLAAAFDSDSPRPWFHATTSRRTWTRHAAWLNLLRGTTACLAAGFGGADSIAVAPFDGRTGTEREHGSELGRRLAINTQVILREECGLSSPDFAADPAHGSWYIESLTDELARAAWRRFQVIERDGGLIRGLRSGAIQAAIADAAARASERVATGKQPITGVTSWPGFDDPEPENADVDLDLDTDPIGDGPPIAAIPLRRLAEPFERLRDTGDAWARTRRRRVFAMTLGPLAHHQPRLDFARNLFGIAGIALVEPDGGGDPIAEFRASGCTLAVVCGRDEETASQAAGLVRGLYAAGAARVWIAGRQTVALEPTGPQPHYLFLGCDALGLLTDAIQLLEVE